MAAAPHRALGQELADLFGGGVVVGGRPWLLEEDLAPRVARHVHRQPAHEAEVGVCVHLESELAYVEVERLVLIEDINL